MGDRSKTEARKAEVARQFEDAKRAEPKPAIRCRSCPKSHVADQAKLEMGGLIFCAECIETAAAIIAVRHAGR